MATAPISTDSPALILGLDLDSVRARRWLGLVVALITLATFWSVNRGGFTNWDDPVYVFQNPNVTTANYVGSLTTPVTNSYNPLPHLIFTWEWNLLPKDQPLMEKAWIFHATSWLLHVLATVLAYLLMQRLGLRPLWAALAALLFGLHPLRVESVAWVTELKDVLLALFYISAMLAYLRYVAEGRRLWWMVTLLLFALALLSKVQAATLPVALLLVDHYQGRRVDFRNIWRKAPFFALSLGLGILGLLLVVREDPGLPPLPEALTSLERVWVAISVFGAYLLKQFVPYATSPAYPMPTAVGLGIYLRVAATIAAGVAALLLRKRSAELWFGFLFFALNVVPMLVNGLVSNSFMADRFALIGSMGIFFGCAMLLQRLANARPVWGKIGLGVLVAYAVLCGILTVLYIPAWQTSFTLWDYVVRHYPKQVSIAYMNRADYYGSINRFDLAQDDYQTVVEEWPENPIGYLLRGRNQLSLGRYAGVVDDMTVVIEAFPEGDLRLDGPIMLQEGYLYRGIAYLRLNRTELAISDIQTALVMRPKDIFALNQLGDAYIQSMDLKAAVEIFTRTIALEPQVAEHYNRRGFCYMNLHDYPPSMADFDRAAELDPQNGQIFNNRAFIHFLMGDKEAALQDAEHAQQLGFPVEHDFLDSLGHQH